MATLDAAATVGQLTAPSPSFRLFRYNEAKIMRWANAMLCDKYYISDDARNVRNILAFIGWHLFGDCLNITYEIGDNAGVMAFSVIIPGHKCKVDWYMWDGRLWGAKFAREAKSLIDMIMRLFNLRRAWSNTNNPRIARFVKSMGGVIEGVKVGDHMNDGKTMDTFMLAYSQGGLT